MRGRLLCLAAAFAFAAITARADPVPRPFAAVVIAAGLKLRTDRAAHPDHPTPDFAAADARRAQILQSVRTALSATDAETAARLTDEARYAGWQVVGFWLAHGESFAEIARVKEADAPARVAEAIDLMLKEPRP